MTEDFVVSCWYIPMQGRRSFESYKDLMMRYADSLDGSLLIQDFQDIYILVGSFTLAPGDTLCKYVSGRYGVKRGGS